MIFDRIVEKVIAKEIEKFKENLIANKDAIIEKLMAIPEVFKVRVIRK